MKPLDGHAALYLCENFACQAPQTAANERTLSIPAHCDCLRIGMSRVSAFERGFFIHPVRQR